MTEGLDRTALVALLEKLGSENDEEVLRAARDIHGMVATGGADWNDLLISGNAPVSESDDAAPEEDGPESPLSDSPIPDDAESLRLIDQLMAMSDLSESLREELEGYRQDIAEKEFESPDRKYLRALHQRLIK